MSARVLLTDAAAHDLDEAYARTYAAGGPDEADRFLDRIEDALAALAVAPDRGAPLPDLLALGRRDGFERRDGPWRWIYRHAGDEVHVVALAHADRSMPSLLTRRLLDA